MCQISICKSPTVKNHVPKKISGKRCYISIRFQDGELQKVTKYCSSGFYERFSAPSADVIIMLNKISHQMTSAIASWIAKSSSVECNKVYILSKPLRTYAKSTTFTKQISSQGEGISAFFFALFCFETKQNKAKNQKATGHQYQEASHTAASSLFFRLLRDLNVTSRLIFSTSMVPVFPGSDSTTCICMVLK